MILHICDGSKGGVGKSQTAQILINYLSRGGQPIVVFETDTQIPDVARSVKDTGRKISLEFADLRTDEGWQIMLETLQDLATDEITKTFNVVMSLPGADLDIPRYSELVSSLVDSLGINVWDWFLLNTQKDSVALLKSSIRNGFSSIAAKKIAVKNGFFGKPDAFLEFDGDKVASQVDLKIYIESLTATAARRLRTETMTIDEVAERVKVVANGQKPDFLYSSNLSTWARKLDTELNRVFGIDK